MSLRRHARLHPVPLLAGVALALLTLQLGNWQTRRAAEKAELQAEYRAAADRPAQPLDATALSEWQSVELHGEWLPGRSILIDNRVHEGRAGYHVFTPLQLTGQGAVVLVNRGWIGAGADRSQPPPRIANPPGATVVTGRVRHPEEKPFMLAADAPSGSVWQALDLARYRSETRLAVADFYVQQTSPADDGLIRSWPEPDAGIERHRGYALQWYALAALATALTLRYLWNAFRSPRHDHRKHL
ncbi:SURF1 family protein [Aromatoleum toluolicum]|uniref:SURF1-like protein n=1 Tax=Aromatoleum toluolicum TaxID=90060 RepID=A0ABX1NBY3_9RHOO|nr:SURF1 family protein [Aromatoleum toluolicum]NMF96767.1 SURF1 family protein [Aromatoleum toluolicum]